MAGILTKIILTGSLTSSLLLNSVSLVSVAEAPLNQEELRIDYILSELAYCESRGNPKAHNQDDGGTPSYGLLQFKLRTFNHFGEKYDLEHTDVTNPSQQVAIAREMLREGRWRHWFTCLSKHYKI